MNEPIPEVALQINLVDLLRDTFALHPELVEEAEWISLGSLFTQTLHKYDLYRVRVMFTNPETGKLATTKMKDAFIAALRKLDYVELRGETVDVMEYRLLEVPQNAPQTLQEALEQIRVYQTALKTWKDLGAMVVDLHGVVNAVKATAEDQERVIRRMAMLAVYYRDKVLEQQDMITLRQDALLRHKITLPLLTEAQLDPTPAQLADIVMKPEQFIKLTRLTNVYNTLKDEADV